MIVFAGAFASPYKSINGGTSWSAAAGGLPAAPGVTTSDILFDPVTPTTVYLATDWFVKARSATR